MLFCGKPLNPVSRSSAIVNTVGFVSLAAVAVGGLVFFSLLMPETKPEAEAALALPRPRATQDGSSFPRAGNRRGVNLDGNQETMLN